MNTCPSPETLERLAYEFLEADEDATVRAHVDSCPDCRTRMNAVVADLKVLTDAAKAVPLPKLAEPKRKATPKTNGSWRWIALAGAAAVVMMTAAIVFFHAASRSLECGAPSGSVVGKSDPAFQARVSRYSGYSAMDETSAPPSASACPEPLTGDSALSGGRLYWANRSLAPASTTPNSKLDSNGYLLAGVGTSTMAPAIKSESALYFDSTNGNVFRAHTLDGNDGWHDGDPNGMYFRGYGVNPFVETKKTTQSTFGLDVDTGSYTIIRRYLAGNRLPPAEAVRVEECVNYFKYHDEAPQSVAFAIHLQAAPSGYRPGMHILRCGVRAKEVSKKERKPAALTFVIDTSGSMGQNNRLELVKQALHELVKQLEEGDSVGIVEYGDYAGDVLDHASNHDKILGAINNLRPRGSTNAAEGIRKGYEMALRNLRKNGINRVILCSDGVANVGPTGPGEILSLIEEQRPKGLTLTTCGFGMGNYNDVLMEQLANKGDGSYHYIDNIKEAKRIFVENLSGTLQTIALDAKVQVEFDPNVVARFRQIGYENRYIRNEDFRNDKIDAGEVGAGHTVTALYEIELADGKDANDLVARVSLRYRDMDTKEVVELARVISRHEVAGSFEKSNIRLRLASTVAEFAEILRHSPHSGGQVYHCAQHPAIRATAAVVCPNCGRKLELVNADRRHLPSRAERMKSVHAKAVELARALDNQEDVREFASLAATAARLLQGR